MMLSQFNLKFNTIVQVDTSNVGLGAALIKINPAVPDKERVVNFASKRLPKHQATIFKIWKGPAKPEELLRKERQWLTHVGHNCSVHENQRTHRTFPLARPKCPMRDCTNLNRIYKVYKAHQTNVWWIMKVFRAHCNCGLKGKIWYPEWIRVNEQHPFCQFSKPMEKCRYAKIIS